MTENNRLFKFEGINFSISNRDTYSAFRLFNLLIKKKFTEFENFINDYLKTYSDKYGWDYVSVTSQILEAIEQGGKVLESEIIKRNRDAEFGGMNYIVNIAYPKNFIEIVYVGIDNFKFSDALYETETDRKAIVEIGERIGKYYYAWFKILDNPQSFEEPLENELKRISKHWNTTPYFPLSNTKIADAPDQLQYATDLNETVKFLNKIINSQLGIFKGGWPNESEKEKLEISLFLKLVDYDNIKPFQDQLYNFIKETTNNTTSSVFKRYGTYYSKLRTNLAQCIYSLNEIKSIFDYDFSEYLNYQDYQENWFKIVFQKLQQVYNKFSEVTHWEELAVGFKCELPEEIIEKVYFFLTDKKSPIIEIGLKDFKKIFNPLPSLITTPIKWLMLSKAGTQKGRGNQTTLYFFLKGMLGSVSNVNAKKAKALFVDDKGEFIKKKLRAPGKEEASPYVFVDQLNAIIEKEGHGK